MVELAAFDFDRTLTRRDTFVPFLRFVAGRRALAAAGLAAIAQTRRSPLWRDRLKADLCRAVFRGRHRAELADAGASYARTVVASGLRRDTVERVRWHQSHGHVVVVVSAGLDTYLSPVAEQLGLDAQLSTTLAFDDAGRATGDLIDGNCRGAEKARRLEAWYEHTGRPDRLWAYGDSQGDTELLAMADRPVRVRRRPLRPEPDAVVLRERDDDPVNGGG